MRKNKEGAGADTDRQIQKRIKQYKSQERGSLRRNTEMKALESGEQEQREAQRQESKGEEVVRGAKGRAEKGDGVNANPSESGDRTLLAGRALDVARKGAHGRAYNKGLHSFSRIGERLKFLNEIGERGKKLSSTKRKVTKKSDERKEGPFSVSRMLRN